MLKKQMTCMTKLQYPFLNAKKPDPNAFSQYDNELKRLGTAGIHAILDKGKQWHVELAHSLMNRGAVLFPHTFLSECGYQIAAAVHAVLDSGADQVLALGVLHPMDPTLMQARSRELNGEDISTEYSWGVFGPELPKADCYAQEFSLKSFKLLLREEARRRGCKAPKLIERYPSLVNREPAKLPGIKELEQIAKDAVIVATDDMFHHGVGYGVTSDLAMPICKETKFIVEKYINDGYFFLTQDDYRGYFAHWMNPAAIGDPTDTAIVLKYLLGNVTPSILDLKLVDVSMLFANKDAPSWVATTLVNFQRH